MEKSTGTAVEPTAQALADYRASANHHRERADAAEAELNTLKAERDALKAELAEARAVIERVEAEIERLASGGGAFVVRDLAVRRFHAALGAPQHPEQLAFDPKQGDLWRDRDGHLWFVISEQSGDFDFDMVCETGSTGYPNDVEGQFGPLVRVYRNEACA